LSAGYDPRGAVFEPHSHHNFFVVSHVPVTSIWGMDVSSAGSLQYYSTYWVLYSVVGRLGLSSKG